MQVPSRRFEFRKAVRERTPLIIGMAGQSGTGKTYSALRLASGMVKAFGGRIAVVDTEARRALHYADRFDFDHVDFEPPFGPLDYMVAIQTAVDRGATVVIVDSMTHEHSGQGGVMDQIDAFLDDKCGNDFGKRDKMNMVAHARIKPQRKALNNYVVQVGRSGVALILCYRANDKTKPVAPKDRAANNGEAMKHVGFIPETTSPLVYEMTQCFLLKPGADGQPTTKPDTDDEKILSKTPIQFKGWSTGQQIDEALGEKLARWAAGGPGAAAFPIVSAPEFSYREWLIDVTAGERHKPDDVTKALAREALDARLISLPADGKRTLGWARAAMSMLWNDGKDRDWFARKYAAFAVASAPDPKAAADREPAEADGVTCDPDYPDDAEPGSGG